MPFPKIRYQWFIIAAAIIFVILSFTILQPEPKPSPLPTIPVKDEPPEGTLTEDLFVPENLTAQYKLAENGDHRFIGSVPLPDSCYEFKILTPVISEDEMDVTLRFRAFKTEEEGCEEWPPEGRYSSALRAHKDATFKVNFNWQEIPLILIDLIDEESEENGAE